MKIIIIFAALLVIATCQVTTLCPGFKNAGTCYNMAYGGALNPALLNCVAYTDPLYCSACGTGRTLSTDKTYCQYDPVYAHYTYFPYGDSDYKNCINYYEQFNTYFADLTQLSYPSLSCYDSNKQLLCRCKPGFVYITSTLKCSACGSNCLTCKSDATSTCYTCAAGYYLGTSNACAPCTTNALTCATASKAASCVSGYYLKSEDGTCVACPSYSTCTSATVFTCVAGYYNASGTCTVCGNNAALCTGVTSATASTNITECVRPDGTNIYYLNSKGCSAVLASKNCLTVTYDTTNLVFKCDTCLYGYTNSEGTCYPCKGAFFTSITPVSPVTYSTIISTCTAGTSSTKASATCGEGYIWNTTNYKCETCASQATLTNCAKCSSMTVCTTCNAGYAVKSDNTCGVCGDATVCKTCSLQSNNSLNICTDYIQYTQFQLGGVATGALTAITATASGGVANCASGRFFIADSYYAGATKKVKCLACSAGYTLYSDAGAGSNVGATLCEISGTTYFDNFANCVAGVVDAAIATIANARCTQCAQKYALVTNACVACNDTTNCATCTSASAGTCTKCLNSKVLVSGVCNTGVNNCKTNTDAQVYNTHNGTAYVCSECDTTSTYYIKNTLGTSCLSCSAVSNCTTYVAVDAACGCSLCKIDLTTSPESYYYLTGTGAQTCTKDSPSNCGYYTSDGKVATCFYCSVGYKWNTTTSACAACSTTFVCATTADTCSSLTYPGKSSSTATAAAANSSIISLVISLLLALITLLI